MSELYTILELKKDAKRDSLKNALDWVKNEKKIDEITYAQFQIISEMCDECEEDSLYDNISNLLDVSVNHKELNEEVSAAETVGDMEKIGYDFFKDDDGIAGGDMANANGSWTYYDCNQKDFVQYGSVDEYNLMWDYLNPEEEKKAEKAIEDGDYEALMDVKIQNAKWEIL